MSTQELFEWAYSPPDYFEEPFEVVRDDYTMTISPGKVEAWVASNTFAENPAIRGEMHAFLNDRFLGVRPVPAPATVTGATSVSDHAAAAIQFSRVDGGVNGARG